MASPCISTSPSPHSSPTSSPAAFDAHSGAPLVFFVPPDAARLPMFSAYSSTSTSSSSSPSASTPSSSTASTPSSSTTSCSASSSSSATAGTSLDAPRAEPDGRRHTSAINFRYAHSNDASLACTGTSASDRTELLVPPMTSSETANIAGRRRSADSGRARRATSGSRPQLPAQLRMGMRSKNMRMMKEYLQQAEKLQKEEAHQKGSTGTNPRDPATRRPNLRELFKQSNSDHSLLEKAAKEQESDVRHKGFSGPRLRIPTLPLSQHVNSIGRVAEDVELVNINKHNEICITQRALRGPSTARPADRQASTSRAANLLSRSASLPSNFKVHLGVAPASGSGVAFLARSGAYEGGATLPQTRTEVEYWESKSNGRSSSLSPEGALEEVQRHEKLLGKASPRGGRAGFALKGERTGSEGTPKRLQEPLQVMQKVSERESGKEREKERKRKKREKERSERREKKDKKKKKEKEREERGTEKERKRKMEEKRKPAENPKAEELEESEEEEEDIDEEVAAASAAMLAARPSAPQPKGANERNRMAQSGPVFSQHFSPRSPRLVRPSAARPSSPVPSEVTTCPITPRSEGHSPPIQSPRSAFSSSLPSPRAQGQRRYATVSGVSHSRQGSLHRSGPSTLGGKVHDGASFLASLSHPNGPLSGGGGGGGGGRAADAVPSSRHSIGHVEAAGMRFR